MNEKYKKRIPKVLPVGIAMGILFSATPLAGPLTESKVKADVDTFGTIVTTFGKVYDAFLAEPFGKWLEEIDVKTTYKASNENVAYKAPTFQKGEFGISAFDFYKDKSFSKKVKIAYANGKVEYKTIKHGEQIRIKDAGTIVDLTPDEADLSKHDILYITQKQLDEGNTGVSLTNFKTYYLKSDNSGGKNVLADRFERQEFPNAFLSSGLRDIRYVGVDFFSQLPEEKRKLATITSEPIGKEVLYNYVTNDSKALADFKARQENVLADTKLILETPLALPFITLNSGEPYQIIPYKKGSNKVFVKTGSKYLSGKEGNNLQYSDSIGDDELFELVQVENSGTGEFQFRLNNKNGVSLAGNQYISGFGTDWSFKSEIRFTAKNNNEIHNWLVDWHPSKVNETKKHEGKTYAGLEFKHDEKDISIWTAYDSGKLITNSWIKRQDAHYYADSSGILLKGWQEIEGNAYYFNPDSNHRVTGISGSDSFIDGKYYYFNDDGVLQKSAWNGLEYSDASGVFIKEGLKEIDNKIYYFKDYKATTNELRLEDQHIILHFSDKGVLEKASSLDGRALSDIGTYVNLDGKKLVFEKDGSIRRNGVTKIILSDLINNTRKIPLLVYYSLEEGSFYTGWKEIDGKKYYFNSGKNYDFDRTLTIDEKKYYFNQEGEVLPTGFIDIDGIPYYLNDKSEKVTGIHKIDGKLYLFSNGDKLRAYGEKVRNTIYSWDGNKYYTDHDGVISQNFKGYVYSHNRDYYIETNNEGVITNIWQR
ncbi:MULTISPECIES: N-acetylmuramoyl-L-alanine amidase family protein [Bacillus cereus group]|uniref:N-acetylmuramoyl-L-alanine amidase family protein n=1 Tax=Bacillus cereus group TaxID=86661 RepID=UPI000B498A67|nr:MULTISPECIES: cell wall-binding protein [Bacillus cereus group]MDH4423780.1 cell wall-binding protein [Bacillus cereus]